MLKWVSQPTWLQETREEILFKEFRKKVLGHSDDDDDLSIADLTAAYMDRLRKKLPARTSDLDQRIMTVVRAAKSIPISQVIDRLADENTSRNEVNERVLWLLVAGDLIRDISFVEISEAPKKSPHHYTYRLIQFTPGPTALVSLPIGALVQDHHGDWVQVISFPFDPHWLKSEWRQHYREARDRLPTLTPQESTAQALPPSLTLRGPRVRIPRDAADPAQWVQETFMDAFHGVFVPGAP